MSVPTVWFAVLLMMAAAPMALRKVPPNSLYGFRTPKTMADKEIWYAANQRAGVNLVAACGLTLLVVGVVAAMAGARKANLVGLPTLVLLVLLSCGLSLVQLRRM